MIGPMLGNSKCEILAYHWQAVMEHCSSLLAVNCLGDNGALQSEPAYESVTH